MVISFMLMKVSSAGEPVVGFFFDFPQTVKL